MVSYIYVQKPCTISASAKQMSFSFTSAYFHIYSEKSEVSWGFQIQISAIFMRVHKHISRRFLNVFQSWIQDDNAVSGWDFS